MKKIYSLIFCIALLNLTKAQTCTPSVVATPSAICSGATTTLTASGATTYSWSGPSLSIGTGATTTANPPSTAVYTVTATTGTCTATQTVVITVNPNPTVTVNSGSTCAGGSVNLCATGATTYTWVPSGGSASCMNVNPSTNTTYTVIGSDPNGCTYITTASVSVNPNPTVNFNMQPSGTPHLWNANATFTGGTAPYTYSWSWGDGTSSNTAFPSHTYAAAAFYNICATVTDANGCMSQVCQNDSLYRLANNSPASVIQVQVYNAAASSCNVAFTGKTDPSCAGMCNGTMSFNVPAGCISTPVYAVWNSGGGCTTIPTASLTPGSTYTVGGICGCGTQYSVIFTNNAITQDSVYGQFAISMPDPVPAKVLNFILNQPSCFGSCNGEVIAQLNTFGALPITIGWTSSTFTNTVIHTTNSHTRDTLKNACAGTYTVNLTDANGCVSTQSVTTLGQPTQLNINFTNVTPPSCSSCSDGTICASVSGGAGVYTYAWAPAGGTVPCINGVPQGSYTFCVTDANGCSLCQVKTIAANAIQSYSNAVPAITLFPNPASNDITISSTFDIRSITIYDILGNVVMQQKQEIKSGQTLKLDIKNFQQGVYFLKADAEGKERMIKFVKE